MAARDDLLAIPDDLLRSGKIAQAVLVHMDFRDTPRRWWTGWGPLECAGHTWTGTGDVIGISNIDTAFNISARKVTFELAATPEMLALALDAKDRVRDRAVTVYCQLFAEDDLQVAGEGIALGQPIGAPFSLFTGTMQGMPWSATGARQRTLKLEAEGLFFRRNAAPRGRWTDADQKARHPGDEGLERLVIYSSTYETRWRG